MKQFRKNRILKISFHCALLGSWVSGLAAGASQPVVGQQVELVDFVNEASTIIFDPQDACAGETSIYTTFTLDGDPVLIGMTRNDFARGQTSTQPENKLLEELSAFYNSERSNPEFSGIFRMKGVWSELNPAMVPCIGVATSPKTQIYLELASFEVASLAAYARVTNIDEANDMKLHTGWVGSWKRQKVLPGRTLCVDDTYYMDQDQGPQLYLGTVTTTIAPSGEVIVRSYPRFFTPDLFAMIYRHRVTVSGIESFFAPQAGTTCQDLVGGHRAPEINQPGLVMFPQMPTIHSN